ncbi:hypothetical protein T4B_14874 [Trichinella pseudospiralis]|uniref:Uncharacterized protein n=1 Tax=Trichinella pseudospiralis TaxID=6337 RepID=A0A0V1GIK7_TRIPS|nr:hypothetical protein T4B_14874 [Trichinella pseudospiralis]
MLTLMSESDGSLHHMLKKNTDNFCSLHIKQYETIRIWEITFNDFFEIMLIPVKFRLWLSHVISTTLLSSSLPPEHQNIS